MNKGIEFLQAVHDKTYCYQKTVDMRSNSMGYMRANNSFMIM
jgi:hypothetical protein